MTIEFLYFDGCPHASLAEERLRVALDRSGRSDVGVHRIEVTGPEHAERLGFLGSPTVRVDGRDPFATGGEEVAFACRLYAGPGGPAGSPTVEQFLAALA